ncbi:transposase [Sediminispirochaeta smaragdinae DSM 11293]|uniref:Transposase n=1 Tax=Sediminispirochaeta smaragdinae (strain DSM 11293 / JCM 15392 / SEBR 4228) TaxID=573413 RepID=E1R9V7_SEDSS|nr:transposase [Sediminispirochaeta smaragdinae DSM 11293]
MDILDEGLEDHLQFFGAESYLRIETCNLIEYTEDWTTSRSYIKKEDMTSSTSMEKKVAI